jgi:hypothetical protein
MISPISFVLALFLLSVSVLASPLPSEFGPLKLPTFRHRGLLCHVPVIDKFLCPCQGPSVPSIDTPLGRANGILDPSGAMRFPVKYASAPRWGPSSMATTWQLP